MRRSFGPWLIGLHLVPFAAVAQSPQQVVDQVMVVQLDDRAHILRAHTTITYTNNSASTLDTLWIHLWPNAYRDRNTALCDQLDASGDLDLHFAKEEERGWIDSLDFSASGLSLKWGYHPEHADIGWVQLNEPLGSGASVIISTPFRVKIPSAKFSRLGHTGQAYHITQWYPKPAVFDAAGWHIMPYLSKGEFFSEYGSFDVTITLPENYVVGATGELQNADERIKLERMASGDLPYPPESLDPRTGRPRPNAFPPSAATTKTLRYTQDRVHDFAWFADKRFIVRKSEVAVGNDGRTVATWALFTPKNAELWKDAVTYVNEAVKHYSQWVGEYPYSACTAIDGTIAAGGGMEYPMITIIGNMDSKESLDNVIAHEVGHNWFYGILGSNERHHAWMDEGMNSFVELRYMRARYPQSGFNIGIPGLKKLAAGIGDAHRAQSELGYRLNARRNLDQPPSLTSSDLTEINYGTMVYMKTALVMDHLMAYLGEEVMDRCMHAYFDEWKFKHPQPDDLRKVFERESGMDLAWVFEDLIGTSEKVDVKVVSLKGNELKFRSRAAGDFPIPITAWNGPDSLGTIWHPGTRTIQRHSHEHLPLPNAVHRYRAIAELPWPNADRVRIDAGNHTLDIDRRNNEVRAHGLFRRGKAPQLKLLPGLERDDRRSIHITPVPAWNGHDGWQFGPAIGNTQFPSQRTEWIVAPLYGLASERWGGAARIEHHSDRIRSELFQNIHLGLSARSAATQRSGGTIAGYEKLSPFIRLDLKRDPLTRPWTHVITLRGVHVKNSARTSTDAGIFARSDKETYLELSHRAQDLRKLHPSFIQPTVTATSDWVRASVECGQAFAYNARNKQLRLRGFAGTFISKPATGLHRGIEAWGLSWGPEDMMYDHAYLERGATKGRTSRQFNSQQGGFKTPFLQGGSDSWIASLNMELDLPFPLPIAAFASIGAVPIETRTNTSITRSTATYFEAGIGLPLIKNVFEIWFPLAVSQRIADEEAFLGRTVPDRIRFVLTLEKLDPTKLLRRLKP